MRRCGACAAPFRTARSTAYRSEYRIPSAEVQDDCWAGDIPPGGYGSYETTATRMVVDDVRVYQRVGRGEPSGRETIPGDE